MFILIYTLIDLNLHENLLSNSLFSCFSLSFSGVRDENTPLHCSVYKIDNQFA